MQKQFNEELFSQQVLKEQLTVHMKKKEVGFLPNAMCQSEAGEPQKPVV
jgi:hypothetical protein